jgi:hypothetical protein
MTSSSDWTSLQMKAQRAFETSPKDYNSHCVHTHLRILWYYTADSPYFLSFLSARTWTDWTQSRRLVSCWYDLYFWDEQGSLPRTTYLFAWLFPNNSNNKDSNCTWAICERNISNENKMKWTEVTMHTVCNILIISKLLTYEELLCSSTDHLGLKPLHLWCF